MSSSTVLDFALTKELLGQLESVRALIQAGQVQGWIGTVLLKDGKEVPYASGIFAADRDAMTKAALRHSMARMKAEDPPLLLHKV